MKSYIVANCVKVNVDDSYKWQSTLFFNNGMSNDSGPSFAVINLKWVKIIDKSRTRLVGDQTYVADGVVIDEEYGVRIEKGTHGALNISTQQECNEWLVIAIELQLLRLGKTLIHAAAVEKDGKVLLMPSWGGVGKTAIVCDFVKKYGWRLLGDDLVIIDDEGVHPFLKPFVIHAYHANLLPEAFSKGNAHIVKDTRVHNLMSRFIPGIKRLLRTAPFVLAFLRKHNPQSMRISPFDLFDTDSLSGGGKLFKIAWLDRCTGDVVIHKKMTAHDLVSRISAVTSLELFAEKMNCVFQMCGSGMFSYQDIFVQMNQRVEGLIGDAEIELLSIPTSASIDEIGTIVYECLV